MDRISIKLPEDFLNEEIRSGYLVTEKLKKVWAVELDLFTEFDRVCKKYNIKYIAWAGTLLGAVRHGGFIPWDDDFDVALLREDFERLVAVAGEEFNEPYFFQTALTDREFFFPYARLRNSNTTGIIKWNKRKNYNNGIYMDIYVLDGLIDCKYKRKAQYFTLKAIGRLIHNYQIKKSENQRNIRKLEALTLQSTIYKVFQYEKMVGLYNKVLSKYNSKSKRYAQIDRNEVNNKKYTCLRSDFERIVEKEYEFIRIPVPANYDSVLKSMYGNYNLFPEENERGMWHNDIVFFDPDKPYSDYFE